MYGKRQTHLDAELLKNLEDICGAPIVLTSEPWTSHGIGDCTMYTATRNGCVVASGRTYAELYADARNHRKP